MHWNSIALKCVLLGLNHHGVTVCVKGTIRAFELADIDYILYKLENSELEL